MTPDEQPRNPKPDRKYYDSDQDYELAMWVWKQEVKNARAAARFNNKVDEKFNTKPTSDGESAINPSTPPQSPEQPVEQPTKPSKQKRAEILAETKKDSPPSTAQEPDAVKPDKTINAPIEDIKPESEKTRSKRRNSLNPIKKQLANISTNASKSARNSGVVRTQILGPIHERLLNLGASIRHATTRINQSERNLEEKIGKVSDIAKDVRSENGKLFDRLKNLRNIGNISRGVAKVRKRIEGINERTKVINKNVKILTDIEPPQQPGIMEMIWDKVGTKLGLVKRSGNAALKNVKGTGNKAKIKTPKDSTKKDKKDADELPSQLGIEAKTIYDRYTSPWSAGTKSRILANMVAPGITALPALARSITGTSKGRGIFKKRNKGQQEVSNAEKVEIKQDKSEQTEDLFEKLKNTIFKVRIVNSDGEDVKTDKNGGTKLVESEDSDSFISSILSKLGLSRLLSIAGEGTAIAAGGGVLATIASSIGAIIAGAGLGVALAGVVEKNELLDKVPGVTPALNKLGAAYGKADVEVSWEDEARESYLAGVYGKPDPSKPSNRLAIEAYKEGVKIRNSSSDKDNPFDDKKEERISTNRAIEDLKSRLGNIGMPHGLRSYYTPEIKDPRIEDTRTKYAPLKDPHSSESLLNDNHKYSSVFDSIFEDTSKKIDDNTKQEPSTTPINVNNVSNSVNTNNSSPTLLAPQAMFDARQSYTRFGWQMA